MAGKREGAQAVLVADVGNSFINLGVLRGEEILATWRITTPERMTADEACASVSSFFGLPAAAGAPRGLSLAEVGDSVLASVVPELTDAWVEAFRRLFGRRPLVVGPGLKTGVPMRYDDPGQLGADRVADLVAARARYESPFIVVDLGTTTNFEVVDAEGVFVGGIIAPGLHLSARAVFAGAAQLADVDLRAPASVIGKNTREAMQAGVVMGEVARIDGLVDAVWAELGCETKVVATGDDAQAMAALSDRIDEVDEHLTLRGLALLHKLNRGR